MKLLDQIIARIKGDDAKAEAIKVTRTRISEIKLQVSKLTYELEQATFGIENIESSLQEEITSPTMYEDKDVFCTRISNAKNELANAEDDKKDIEHSLEYFNTLLKDFQA